MGDGLMSRHNRATARTHRRPQRSKILRAVEALKQADQATYRYVVNARLEGGM